MLDSVTVLLVYFMSVITLIVFSTSYERLISALECKKGITGFKRKYEEFGMNIFTTISNLLFGIFLMFINLLIIIIPSRRHYSHFEMILARFSAIYLSCFFLVVLIKRLLEELEYLNEFKTFSDEEKPKNKYAKLICIGNIFTFICIIAMSVVALILSILVML